MSLFETHAHLCDPQFDSDRSLVLERAREKGIEALVEIADSPAGWEPARALSAGSNGLKVFWACGFHPHHAQEQENFNFDTMAEAAAEESCVAVGEIGLDYVKSAAPKEIQISLFRKALEVAASVEKPVVIHCREAQADTLRILKSFYSGLSGSQFSAGVIHCFSGDLNFALGCMDLGFYLGVDGPITYPGSKLLREVIAQAPLERIVLETDCPYLPPQGFRGQRNEPAYLSVVAEKLAQVSGKSLETVAQTTTQNAVRLFRIKPKLKS